jgi:hypothetical protein
VKIESIEYEWSPWQNFPLHTPSGKINGDAKYVVIPPTHLIRNLDYYVRARTIFTATSSGSESDSPSVSSVPTPSPLGSGSQPMTSAANHGFHTQAAASSSSSSDGGAFLKSPWTEAVEPVKYMPFDSS